LARFRPVDCLARVICEVSSLELIERETEAREILAKIRADYADTPLAKKAKGIVWQLDLKNMPAEEDEQDDSEDDGKREAKE